MRSSLPTTVPSSKVTSSRRSIALASKSPARPTHDSASILSESSSPASSTFAPISAPLFSGAAELTMQCGLRHAEGQARPAAADRGPRNQTYTGSKAGSRQRARLPGLSTQTVLTRGAVGVNAMPARSAEQAERTALIRHGTEQNKSATVSVNPASAGDRRSIPATSRRRPSALAGPPAIPNSV